MSELSKWVNEQEQQSSESLVSLGEENAFFPCKLQSSSVSFSETWKLAFRRSGANTANTTTKAERLRICQSAVRSLPHCDLLLLICLSVIYWHLALVWLNLWICKAHTLLFPLWVMVVVPFSSWPTARHYLKTTSFLSFSSLSSSFVPIS